MNIIIILLLFFISIDELLAESGARSDHLWFRAPQCCRITPTKQDVPGFAERLKEPLVSFSLPVRLLSRYYRNSRPQVHHFFFPRFSFHHSPWNATPSVWPCFPSVLRSGLETTIFSLSLKSRLVLFWQYRLTGKKNVSSAFSAFLVSLVFDLSVKKKRCVDFLMMPLLLYLIIQLGISAKHSGLSCTATFRIHNSQECGNSTYVSSEVDANFEILQKINKQISSVCIHWRWPNGYYTSSILTPTVSVAFI